MTTQTANHFSDVISAVQQAPQGQKQDRLIDGIAAQMQQSGNQSVQQWGEDLKNLKPQLVRACQQQGG